MEKETVGMTKQECYAVVKFVHTIYATLATSIGFPGFEKLNPEDVARVAWLVYGPPEDDEKISFFV